MIDMESVSVCGKVWTKRHRGIDDRLFGGPDDYRTLGCCMALYDISSSKGGVNKVYGLTRSDWTSEEHCFMEHNGRPIYIGNVHRFIESLDVTLIDLSETFLQIIGTQVCVDGVDQTADRKQVLCMHGRKVEIITCSGVTHGRIKRDKVKREPPSFFTKHDLGGIVRSGDTILGYIHYVTADEASVQLLPNKVDIVDIKARIFRVLKLVTTETYPDIVQYIRGKWFSRACAKGKRKVHQIRLMAVGMFGVGKTYLCRRLLGLPYDSKRDKTTNGVHVCLGECVIKRDVAVNWRKLSEKEQEERCVKLFAEQMLASNKMPVNFLYEEREGPEVNAMNYLARTRHRSHGHISTRDDHDVKYSKDVDDDVAHAGTISPKARISGDPLFDAVSEHLDQKNKVTSPQAASKSFIKTLFMGTKTQIIEHGEEVELSVWDFGGQHVFYNTHQTFLTWRAIYLLVVDLTKDLNQEIQLKRDSLFNKKSIVQGMPKKLGEFVEFWLKTIHTHSICRWQPPEGADKLCPPIFIVGTHRDKLGGNENIRIERTEERFEEIRTFLMSRQPHCDHVNSVFFAVDNTNKNDPSLQDLKNAILKVSQKQWHWGEERPLRWLQIEGKLSEIATYHQCINFATAEEYARDYNIGAKELAVCLSFYHEVGTFVYFDETELRKIVVLDPQWLIDAFKAVITLPQYQHVEKPWHRRYWELLEEKGILREQLVDLAWKSDKQLIANKAILLNIMQRYDLAHPYPSIAMETDPPLDPQEKLFVIPSLLPDVKPDEVILKDKVTPKALYVQFKYDFIPHGLFHRLLVCLLRKLKLHSRLLFGNYACFRLPKVNVSPDDFTEDVRVFEIHCDGFRIKLNVGSLDHKDHIQTPCEQVLSIRDLVSKNIQRLKQYYYPNLKQNFAIAVEPNDLKGKGTIGKLSYIPIEKADVQRGFAVHQGYSEIIDAKPYGLWFREEADLKIVQQVPESQITKIVQQLVPGPQAMPIQQPATSQQSLPGQQRPTTSQHSGQHNVSAQQSTATQQVFSGQRSLSARQQVAGQLSPSLPQNIVNQPSASLPQDMQRFARLGYLVIHYGAQVLRVFLLREVVEPGLKQSGVFSSGNSVAQMITKFLALQSTQMTLQSLRSRVLHRNQWDLLYPGQGQPDIEKWDVTLLFLLIRNLHPNKANISWSLNQAQARQGEVDLVIKIKEYRNTISHGQFQLQTAEYENMWQEMSTVIVQLGGSQKEIDALKVDNFNEEQFRHITQQVVKNQTALQQMDAKLDEVLTRLNCIRLIGFKETVV